MMMVRYLCCCICCLVFAQVVAATEVLRILTWEGYVSNADLNAVNSQLRAQRIDARAEVIKSYASGQKNMYEILRRGQADVSFLTLNYLKMQDGQIERLLQPIDTSRLSHYANVLPVLARMSMGLDKNGWPLYVPFGAGAYGIWVNMDQFKPEQWPKKLSDLLAPQWRGHLALTRGQIQPNVALAFMALGEPAFLLNDLAKSPPIDEMIRLGASDGSAQKFLNALYAQVGEFWDTAPSFREGLWLVASYGPEIAGLHARGQNWQLLRFAEGNTVWMDTMNIVHDLNETKTRAAYVFIDHMLSAEVQKRVVEGLSMVAVVSGVANPLLDENPQFFLSERFWPPYEPLADNLMHAMSKRALLLAPTQH